MAANVKYSHESLFDEYKKMYNPVGPSLDNLSSQSGIPNVETSSNSSNYNLDLRKKREEEYRRELIREEGDCESLSELDVYLSDKKEKNSPDFDILMWWRFNTFRYPTLEKMAADLLAMPVSTNASETTFSTSGRIIDDFRSSLTPKTVQALICAQDWLKNEIPRPPLEEEFQELLRIEADAIAAVECHEPVIDGI